MSSLSPAARTRFCSISGASCSTSISPRRSPAGRDMPAASRKPSSRAMCGTAKPTGCTRSARSATRPISHSLRASLGIGISDAQFLEGWNAIFAGEMPDIAELLPRAAKQLPLYAFSNTNRPHVDHFSKEYAGLLGHFRELYLSSSIGLRKPDAGGLRPCRGRDRRAGEPHRVLRRSCREHRRSAVARPDRGPRDLAPRRRERPQGARNLISGRQADGPRMDYSAGGEEPKPFVHFYTEFPERLPLSGRCSFVGNSTSGLSSC